MKKNLLRSRIIVLSALIAITAFFISCQKEYVEPTVSTQETLRKATASPMAENFESGTKTAYTAASVTLTSGSWYFNDALLGTLSTDRKNGTKSARIRNTGKITMQFDYANGASTVDIYHAKFGTDATSTWDLYLSTNGGTSWTKMGSTVTTSSTTLTKVSFTVSQSGNVRFEIRKISGGTARINIDDFTINDYSGGGGGGGTPSCDDNMALGNPSGAVTSTSYPNNYLMTKTQYTMSYNDSKRTCNWVSWHLSTAWIGTTPRQDDFRADVTLPAGWVQVGATDFSGSGFDRGHMCPSADRTGSVADNSATFLMTNMIPQAPINNQQTWVNLENYCRTLINAGNELYIISGPWGQGGTGSAGAKTLISTKNIVVPAYVWKIVVVLPVGTNDVTRITSATRVIAIWTPNTQSVSSAWGGYRTTVDYIENQTGYDFLNSVSTTIQSAIESTVDTGATS
ncbi:MAG: DNA/RNA non-specific endonuclease [Bacteroidales bacterium]|nr:DNA/RNA non-specific endonuclease [Bacteroidales bacterium]